MNLDYIRRAVAACREQYPALSSGSVPIDMVEFLELDLHLSLIPIPGLRSRYGVDAALIPDDAGVYVDEESYDALENDNSWLAKRLRFTLAHEFAHSVLHRNSPYALRWTSAGDYAIALCSINQETEREADEFAGQLLVPAEILANELAKRPRSLGVRTNPNARRFFAEQIAPRFGVNPIVVEIRLDREGIWPAL